MDNTEQPRIMVVDDEDMVITSIRAFLTLETDWEVFGHTDPESAAEALKSQTVDVVVSDYLMPRMNGMQLLGKAREIQPEAARVLLTGHADKQSAIVAINEIGLYQYLEKPWDNAQLLLVLKSANERTRLLRRLQETIARLDKVQAQLIRAFL